MQGSAGFTPTVLLVRGVAQPQGHPSIAQHKQAGGDYSDQVKLQSQPQQDQSHHLPTAQRAQVSPRSQSTPDSVEQSQDTSRPQGGCAEAAALLQGQKKQQVAMLPSSSSPSLLHPGEERWAAPRVHVHCCRAALRAGGDAAPTKVCSQHSGTRPSCQMQQTAEAAAPQSRSRKTWFFPSPRQHKSCRPSCPQPASPHRIHHSQGEGSRASTARPHPRTFARPSGAELWGRGQAGELQHAASTRQQAARWP